MVLLLSVLGPLCAGMGGKKKKRMMYLTTKNAGKHITAILFIYFFRIQIYEGFWHCSFWRDAEFDRHELKIYEEVAKVPPFRRKTLVLIGAQGVGRRSLKNKLMVSDPQRYGTTIPCESSHYFCILQFPFLQFFFSVLHTSCSFRQPPVTGLRLISVELEILLLTATGLIAGCKWLIVSLF